MGDLLAGVRRSLGHTGLAARPGSRSTGRWAGEATRCTRDAAWGRVEGLGVHCMWSLD